MILSNDYAMLDGAIVFPEWQAVDLPRAQIIETIVINASSSSSAVSSTGTADQNES
jgi:hypothetical protein